MRRRTLERKHGELEGRRARARHRSGSRRERRRRSAAAVLIACHPVLSKDARVALTLRLVGGLTTDEIARAFLVPEPTIAQRIVRAKRTLAEARVPFEVPRGAELRRARALGARGHLPRVQRGLRRHARRGLDCAPISATTRCASGASWPRFVPGEAEVHGLVALMELQASRTARAPWAGRRADPAVRPGSRLAGTSSSFIAASRRSRAPRRSRVPSAPYTLQAAIAACHARAQTAAATDWKRIVALYDALVELTGSPVVELNRAVAVELRVRSRRRVSSSSTPSPK